MRKGLIKMKIETKNWEIAEEKGRFLALQYMKKWKYEIGDYLNLFCELDKKGYDLIFEVEWKYLIFKKRK